MFCLFDPVWVANGITGRLCRARYSVVHVFVVRAIAWIFGFWFSVQVGITEAMKRTILDAILKELEVELARQQGANEQSNRGAMHSAPNAEKQRDTTGLEAAYLAHGYARQCTTLAKQIEELKSLKVEDFTGQEIDVGALVEVEMNGETDHYMLLHCGGGSEVTVITPESPLGKALAGNIEAGAFSIRPGMEGIILNVG